METAPTTRVGALLREWRQRRRLSQLDLSLLADTSARHLSYLETGRALPSRSMVLRLSEALDVPLRERNVLLMAADYAPAYRESSLDDEDMAAIRAALDMMMKAHEPYPAVVVDRLWNLVAGNGALGVLMDGIPDHLLAPVPNVFRLMLHPEGLAARLANLDQVRDLTLTRLRRQVEATGDAELRALYDEVSTYPDPAPPAALADGSAPPHPDAGWPDTPAARPSPIQVPIRVRTPVGVLSMFGTMTTFGTPADVTLSELAIELFYPLDEFTAAMLRGRVAPPK
ncbi:helix-turn-helix domain-containing protein [Streptodolium elevatio]|uniref:Helix-turn-helix transcriptional regulator n=1 Tax=Streptodolium elevatio TaxID=3157996 RepID=A0ABV3D900_9ACTN